MINTNSSITEIKAAFEGAENTNERCKVSLLALDILDGKESSYPFEVDELRGRISSQLNRDKEELTEEFITKIGSYGITELSKDDIMKGELNLSGKLRLSDAKRQEVYQEIYKLSFLTSLDLSINLLTSLPSDIGKLSKLTELFVGDSLLTSLPPDIGKLTNLRKLYLNNNKLSSLPPDIGKLTNLTDLFLKHNKLTSLPPDIGKLTSLILLELSGNQLTSLPSDIGKLTNLENLDICDNQLTSLPPDFGELTELTELNLSRNQLTFLPPDIVKLTELTWFYLGENKLSSLPSDIGKLTELTVLNLSENQLVTLPASISALSRNTANLTTLQLYDNPIAFQATSETELGRQELCRAFGDRVVLSNANLTAMRTTTSFEEVNNKLDRNELSIQRATFKELQAPPIPGEAFSCEEMLNELKQLLGTFDMENLQSPLYLSFKNMTVDWDLMGKSNKDGIEKDVRPKLTGFVKELYGLDLGPEDLKANMMMYEKDFPETRRVLSFILRELQKEEFGRSDHFEQLTAGILHCQTGQSEAINATAYGLLGVPTSDLPEDRIKMWAGLFKNQIFQQALLTKAGDNTQNVHLLDHYRKKLESTLGLSSAIEGYEDRIGSMGFDPFNNNPANAYKTYMSIVTPERMIASLVASMQTQTDRKAVEDRSILQSILQNLPAKKQEDRQQSVMRLKTLLENEKISKEHKEQIERQITQMQRSPEPTPEERNVLDGLSKKYGVEVKNLDMHLTGLIQSNSRLRPFSVGDMIDLMKNPEAQENWWKGLLTSDPEDQKTTITYEGAKQILIKMDILKGM